MTDLNRLYRVQCLVDAADDAIAATSIQAKPAIKEILTEAYHLCGDVMRHGARKALEHGAAGQYQRLNLSPGLIERLSELAQEKKR